MLNNLILTLMSINDGLDPSICKELIKNKPITYNTKTIFLLNKNIFSMLLPNFGRVCGYPLYNNIMNFCYNNFIQSNEKLPLNHGLILNNGNFFINIKNISNNYLISNNKNFLINAKNALSTILWGNSSSLNNNELEESLSLNNSIPIERSNIENINNNISNVENSTISSSSSINNDISLTVSTNASSSSNSLIVNHEENLNEKKFVFGFYINTKDITIANGIITSINNFPKQLPLISTKELISFFIKGPESLITSKILLMIYEEFDFDIESFNNKMFNTIFFSLSPNFITEFKILVTLFNNEIFDFNNEAEKSDIFAWFSDYCINTEIDRINRRRYSDTYEEVHKNFNYKTIISSMNNFYYTDFNIKKRQELAFNLDNNLGGIDLYKNYNHSFDQLYVLTHLSVILCPSDSFSDEENYN